MKLRLMTLIIPLILDASKYSCAPCHSEDHMYMLKCDRTQHVAWPHFECIPKKANMYSERCMAILIIYS